MKKHLNERTCIKRTSIIWKIHKNWKIATRNFKLLVPRISHKQQLVECVSVLLKQRRPSYDIFVKNEMPNEGWCFDFHTENNQLYVPLSFWQKHAHSFDNFCEKNSRPIRNFGALPFPLKTTERVCSLVFLKQETKKLRAISLELNRNKE